MNGSVDPYVTKAGERRYRVRWDLPPGPDGRRRQRARRGFRTEKDALAAMVDLADEVGPERFGSDHPAVVIPRLGLWSWPADGEPWWPSASRLGYTYVLWRPEVDLVKIGRSVSPETRAAQVEAHTGGPLYGIAYTTDGHDEPRLHRALAPFRRHGEWFERAGEVHWLMEYHRDRRTA